MNAVHPIFSELFNSLSRPPISAACNQPKKIDDDQYFTQCTTGEFKTLVDVYFMPCTDESGEVDAQIYFHDVNITKLLHPDYFQSVCEQCEKQLAGIIREEQFSAAESVAESRYADRMECYPC